MNYTTIKRVALYIRVSTEEQALHGYSLDAQEDALKEYAEKNGYMIAGIYRDEGFSARKPAIKRPKMQELLADVKAGKIDLILFTKLDRWFRPVREYHTVQAVLDKSQVAWQAILEDYSTTTADGRLKVNIMLSVAENEADRTSERIKFVFNSKLQKGEYCYGGAATPWGYKAEVIDGVRRLVKDPELQEATAAFWDKMLKYRNIRRSGREVNLEFGLNRAHKSWMATSRNEIYTGELRGVKNLCEPYISRADWESLQRPENRIKSTQGNRVYLFVGLLRCPVCGCTLKSNYKTYPADRTKEFYSYRCSAKSLGHCTYNHALSERKVEKYLLANIKTAIEEYIVQTRAEADQKKKSPKKADAGKLQEQLRRLNNIYMAGNIGDEEYNAQAAAIKATLAEAERAEDPEAHLVDLEALRDFLADGFTDAYASMSRDERQRFWHTIIKEIHVDGLRITEIIFK